MSDTFPSPPPPPPDLYAPPPGGGAPGTNWGRVPFKRVRGLTTAILVLAVAAAVGSIVDLAFQSRRVDIAREFLVNRDEDAFNEDFLAANLGTFLLGLATLALVVVSIIWLYRIVSNHRLLGRRTTWSPGFAIGGWFLPPVLYVIPLLILRESWKAADPQVAPGNDRWREGSESPLPYVWFVLYSLVPLALGIAGAGFVGQGFGASPEDIAEQIIDSRGIATAQSIVSVVAAASWALLARSLAGRHAQLTGELPGR